MYDQCLNRLTGGLKRKGITKPSQWACTYRKMLYRDAPNSPPIERNWTFKYHPWLKEPHDSRAPLNIFQKSAQMGASEMCLNVTFYHMDILQNSVLYVLPNTDPDASVFSASRFNPAIESSDHLMQMYSAINNVGHKRAGNTNLYVRGSKSRSGLKSLPVGHINFDEVDEMMQKHIPLALERMSGQEVKSAWMISTPTLPDFGINSFYKNSTQEHFFFRCPACSRTTELTYPDCFVLTGESLLDNRLKESYIQCKECKTKLTHELKYEWLNNWNEWVAQCIEAEARGFHINQLYSSTISPYEFAKAVIAARFDPEAEKELYNSKCGLPFVPSGAQVTDTDLIECSKPYLKGTLNPKGLITMGVDVGKRIHFEIDYFSLKTTSIKTIDITSLSKARVLMEGTVDTFEELDGLMNKFNVRTCVCDLQPERRKAFEFASRHPKRVKLCSYTEGISNKAIHVQENRVEIHVDRTSWLDASLGRFRNRTVMIPMDTSLEYKEHIKAQVRIIELDKNGNGIARYTNVGKPDHFGHARNYAEIGLPIASGIGRPSDIVGSL